MPSQCLKMTTVGLALAGAAAAESSIVLIQGRTEASLRGMAWTLSENGALTKLGSAEAFKVPAGRSLVITEAAFTVRGGFTRAVRAAQFRISMRVGPDTLDLAECSGRVAAGMAATTVARTFRPGLVAPSGAEVRAAMTELEPGGGAAKVEATLYGYLLPTAELASF